MEETEILSNLNIYGWIFTIALGAVIGGWIGFRLVILITGWKLIHKKAKNNTQYKPIFDYRGMNSKIFREAKILGKKTVAGFIFRGLFWIGLVALIIILVSICLFDPSDFSFRNGI